MKAMLIDGNSLLYRGYYASAYSPAGVLTNSKGQAVNAVLTFNNILARLFNAYNPTHVLVAFDAGKKTRRHEKLESYKAGRAATPIELISQFSIAKEMLDLMNVSREEIIEIEADDIIASMTTKIPKEYEVLVVSSDRDLFQLVDERISIVVPQNGSKPDLIVTKNNFEEVFGCKPSQVPDLKAIMGDASDNLPGVKGIGEKGALKLITDYGSLESIYQNISGLTPAIQAKLNDSKAMAFICKDLATLDKNVKISLNWEEIAFFNKISPRLIDFFKKYELNSLVKRYEPLIESNTFDKIIF